MYSIPWGGHLPTHFIPNRLSRTPLKIISTYRKIRSIRLQPTQDATIFFCKMPPSFDAKPNTVNVACAKVSYRCPAVHTSWAEPSVVIRSLLLSVVCCLHFLWNRQHSSLQGPLGVLEDTSIDTEGYGVLYLLQPGLDSNYKCFSRRRLFETPRDWLHCNGTLPFTIT